jgi:intein/homing endonuclease
MVFEPEYPEAVFAYAVKALCDEYDFSQDDLCMCRFSASLKLTNSKETRDVKHIRRIPVAIDMPMGMLPKKDQGKGKLIVQTQAALHDGSWYDRYDVGLREYVIFNPDQRNRPQRERDSVRFWHWNGEFDDHPLSFSIFVEKRNLFSLRKFARKIEKHSATNLEPPVLPRGMLTDIYKNTIGFLVDGKEKKAQYDKYNIPYKRGALLCGKPGCGKCCSLDTPVFTNSGLLPIGEFIEDLAVDDATDKSVTIWNKDGHREETAQIYNGGWRDTKKISTRFGYQLEGTWNHRVIVTDGQDITWKRLDEIEEGDFVAVPRKMMLFGYKTDISYAHTASGRLPVSLPSVLDDDLAYLLGLLTGDGNLTTKNRIAFSTADLEREYVALFSRLFSVTPHVQDDKRRDGLTSVTIESVQIKGFLKLLGLGSAGACQKSVPRCILEAPQDCVRAFLQGLFDTDGWADTTGRVGFDSCSEELARTVHLMLTNFGIISSLRHKPNDYNGAWAIDINGKEAKCFFDEIGFRVARKQIRFQEKKYNTNYDIVPYDPDLLRDVCKLSGNFNRRMHAEFQRYKDGTQRMSHGKSERLLQLVDETKIGKEVLARMRNIARGDIFWDQVKSNVSAQNFVADFYVPESHSFAAGGFINHNTMTCKWLRNLAIEHGFYHRVITLEEYEDVRRHGSVRQLFTPPRNRSAIVFFDDLDVMIKDRKTGNYEILPFLTNMDGIYPTEGIVFVFTANEMVELDEAFVRPGRIDLWLPFSAPGEKLRTQFITERFQQDMLSVLDISDLTERTKDYTFAEMEEIRKLFALDIISHKKLDTGRTFRLFDRHRNEFQDRIKLGFNQMEEDDGDWDEDDEELWEQLRQVVRNPRNVGIPIAEQGPGPTLHPGMPVSGPGPEEPLI